MVCTWMSTTETLRQQMHGSWGWTTSGTPRERKKDC
jgi:hypothetical protein